jgi:hypothetical protein
MNLKDHLQSAVGQLAAAKAALTNAFLKGEPTDPHLADVASLKTQIDALSDAVPLAEQAERREQAKAEVARHNKERSERLKQIDAGSPKMLAAVGRIAAAKAAMAKAEEDLAFLADQYKVKLVVAGAVWEPHPLDSSSAARHSPLSAHYAPPAQPAQHAAPTAAVVERALETAKASLGEPWSIERALADLDEEDAIAARMADMRAQEAAARAKSEADVAAYAAKSGKTVSVANAPTSHGPIPHAPLDRSHLRG